MHGNGWKWMVMFEMAKYGWKWLEAGNERNLWIAKNYLNSL